MGEEVTEDQIGAPEREIEVTAQPREMAEAQIREPGKKLMKSWGGEGERTEEAVATADDELFGHFCDVGLSLSLHYLHDHWRGDCSMW